MFVGDPKGVPQWPETAPGGGGTKRQADWWGEEQDLPRLISECHIAPTKRQRLFENKPDPVVYPRPTLNAADTSAAPLPNVQQFLGDGRAMSAASVEAPPPAPFPVEPIHQHSPLAPSPFRKEPPSPPTSLQNPPSPSLQTLHPTHLALVPFAPPLILPPTPTSPSPPAPSSTSAPSATSPRSHSGSSAEWPPLLDNGVLTEWGKRLVRGTTGVGDIGGTHGALLDLATGRPLQIKGGKSLTEALDLVGANEPHPPSPISRQFFGLGESKMEEEEGEGQSSSNSNANQVDMEC